ncbi:MAG: hypothetical protein AB7P14_04355 [Blastocatellales bacterium]
MTPSNNHPRIYVALLSLVVITVGILLIGSTASAKKLGEASTTIGSTNFAAKEMSLSQAEACGVTTWNLIAGQTIDVGSVTVSNDADNIYVTYALDYPGACFGTLQVWVGNSLLNLPANQNGTPIPGQFCQSDGGSCYDAHGLTSYTFTIPFSAVNIVDVTQVCNTQLYVVTHAEVDLDCNEATAGHETAFGGDITGGGPRWWFYGAYTICCDFGPPQPPFCQTAYAKGGYVWTTDRKSNPERLPSLNLTKNRWGWAINLTATGTTTYDIWAGAGLNNTANGVKVGTLTVNWDGTNVTVTYNLDAGYYLEEVHLYAEDGSPTTIAPGQYGYLDQFNPNRTSYTFNVPLVDMNGTGGVWVVAHAVVCNQQ